MFFFGILMLLVIAVFFAVNLVSAMAALFGLGMVLLQLTHRNKSLWPWLIAFILLLGGVGALGGAWGLYYIVGSSWADTNCPEVSWLAGYLAGGAVGVILGVVKVIRWKGDDVKRGMGSISDFFRNLRDEFAELPG